MYVLLEVSLELLSFDGSGKESLLKVNSIGAGSPITPHSSTERDKLYEGYVLSEWDLSEWDLASAPEMRSASEVWPGIDQTLAALSFITGRASDVASNQREPEGPCSRLDAHGTDSPGLNKLVSGCSGGTKGSTLWPLRKRRFAAIQVPLMNPQIPAPFLPSPRCSETENQTFVH